MGKKESIVRHKFIVFCSDHYNPLGVVRSLGECGIRPIVILDTQYNKPTLIVKSKYPKLIHKVDNKEEGLALLIKEYGNEKEKPFVYSCSDEICELLDNNYDKLIDKFYFFHGKEKNAVSEYLNKNKINQLAVECGCSVLNNEIVKRGDLPHSLRYPVLTKALSSTLHAWKDEMNICKDENELCDAYKKIRSDRVLVQEYIKKKNEYCLDGFSFDGGNKVYIPYYSSYLRFSDMSYGAYMEIRPFDDTEVYVQICRILKEVGYTGIFEVEFLVDDKDKKWFLEVNFRNSTWSYAYTYGGYNMPYLWAEGTLYNHIDIDYNKRLQHFTAMAEYEDYVMSVIEGNKSLDEWIEDFYRADVHYFYNEKDLAPFSIKNFITKKKLKKLIGKK